MSEAKNDVETPTEEAKTEIVFYCKTCQKLVEKPVKVGNKYVYKCPECKKDNVAFGTKESIESHFRI